MPPYKTTEQLYHCAGALFERIQIQNPKAAQSVSNARLLIQLRCVDPAGEIIINGRQRPLITSFGPISQRPDLLIELSSFTLHQILLGDLLLPKAIGNGSLKVTGPIIKALTLAELFMQGQSIYPTILREQGLSNR